MRLSLNLGRLVFLSASLLALVACAELAPLLEEKKWKLIGVEMAEGYKPSSPVARLSLDPFQPCPEDRYDLRSARLGIDFGGDFRLAFEVEAPCSIEEPPKGRDLTDPYRFYLSHDAQQPSGDVLPQIKFDRKRDFYTVSLSSDAMRLAEVTNSRRIGSSWELFNAENFPPSWQEGREHAANRGRYGALWFGPRAGGAGAVFDFVPSDRLPESFTVVVWVSGPGLENSPPLLVLRYSSKNEPTPAATPTRTASPTAVATPVPTTLPTVTRTPARVPTLPPTTSGLVPVDAVFRSSDNLAKQFNTRGEVSLKGTVGYDGKAQKPLEGTRLSASGTGEQAWSPRADTCRQGDQLQRIAPGKVRYSFQGTEIIGIRPVDGGIEIEMRVAGDWTATLGMENVPRDSPLYQSLSKHNPCPALTLAKGFSDGQLRFLGGRAQVTLPRPGRVVWEDQSTSMQSFTLADQAVPGREFPVVR